MGQTIVSGADAQIQWCCDEITSAGLQTVTGVNANGTIATAGTYFARATLEVRGQTNALISPTINLQTDDNVTNLNTSDGLPLEWTIPITTGVGGFSWDPGDPTKITALYSGEARFTVGIQADNGLLASSADEVDIFIVRNDGADVLKGIAGLRFDTDNGLCHGLIVTIEDDVQIGDYFEVFGAAQAPIVNPVTLTGSPARHTYFIAERLTIPGISAHLDLYDPTDTFVETIDTQSVSGFDYAFSLGGVFSAQSGFKVKAFVGHSDESQTFTVTDESHMDVIKVGGYLPWETC